MADIQSAVLAFGKIPAQGDFVRLGARSTTVDYLDTWLQEGLTELKRQRGSQPDDGEPRPVHLIYSTPFAPEVLVGALVMSRDRVGRRYPLLVARALHRSFLDVRHVPFWPVVWHRLLREAASLAVQAVTELDAARLAERLETLPPLPDPANETLQRAHAEALRRATAADFWTTLWGDDEAVAKYAVFSRLLESFRPGRRTAVPAFGLSFPTARNGAPLAAEAVWLDAVWRLLQRPTELPVLAWSTGDTGGRLVIFPAGAPRGSAAAVLGGEVNARLILEMDAPLARPTDAVVSLPHRYGTLLEAPDLPLAAFLNSL
jgi:type VI secretion system protein ImpM